MGKILGANAAFGLPVLRPEGAGNRQRESLEEVNLDLAGLGPVVLASIDVQTGRSTDLVKLILQIANDISLFIDTPESKFAREKEKELVEAFEQANKTIPNFVKFARQRMSDTDEEDNKELFDRIEKSLADYPAVIRKFITGFRRFLKNPRREAKAFLELKQETDKFAQNFIDDLSTLGKLSAKRRKR